MFLLLTVVSVSLSATYMRLTPQVGDNYIQEITLGKAALQNS